MTVEGSGRDTAGEAGPPAASRFGPRRVWQWARGLRHDPGLLGFAAFGAVVGGLGAALEQLSVAWAVAVPALGLLAWWSSELGSDRTGTGAGLVRLIGMPVLASGALPLGRWLAEPLATGPLVAAGLAVAVGAAVTAGLVEQGLATRIDAGLARRLVLGPQILGLVTGVVLLASAVGAFS